MATLTRAYPAVRRTVAPAIAADSTVATLVVPTDEELEIAEQTLATVSG